MIRKAFLELLDGKRTIPMDVVSFPDMEDTEDTKLFQKELLDNLKSIKSIQADLASTKKGKN